MNFKYMAIVAVIAATLIATTAITTDSTFAIKYKGKNQALSQVNECRNGILSENVGCRNTASQAHGDENSVDLASVQLFP
jgi:hypothetical protein